MTAEPLAGVKVCCSLISPFPEKNARAIKIAESLAAAGAEVAVLFVARGEPTLPTGNFRAVPVRPTDIKPSEHPSRFLRVAYNVLVAIPLIKIVAALQARGFDPALFAALRRESADVYHAYVLDTAVPAYRAARLRFGKRAKLIYDIRDFYADSRARYLTEEQQAYWRRQERRLAQHADLVLAISYPMAELVSSRHAPVARTEVLFNGPWECTQQAEPPHRPVRLFFQGFFEADRNLDSLIGAMQHLRGRATLTLQGWGGCEAELRRRVEELDLGEYVRFVEPCPPTDVIACGRAYDVGVVCHRGSTPNHDIAVPNKFLDYIGSGLAVAGSDLPGIRSILDEYACGTPIDPTNAETMAEGLSRMVEDPANVARMKEAATRACRELCWDRQAEHLVGWYRELLGRGSSA